ncbi:nucleotide exchange factor GrpE [Bizionia myxarmorum]|uniref:Protein GrpE n=1 Tax=Bizionia myxarmorum TaxID=291186 RepID=A0A5D0RCZ8_9FLAO|nr:nucleotide exchange factor GrpE [Bizionia myxarmorum]TYB79550.1 nucleotide exchange factor GrpE [Bizionia myxarmorum]
MSKKDKNDDSANEQIDDQHIDNSEETTEDTRTVEEQLQDSLAQEKDKFLRLFAEFENYKRRTAKERSDLFKTAGQDVMVALLPILDDFDRAYNEISKTKEKDLLKGVELIRNKLNYTLENKGLELMELKTGDDFNADNHEAITQIPAPTDALKGKIIDVVEKGYRLGDKIIRFPKVVIGQ